METQLFLTLKYIPFSFLLFASPLSRTLILSLSLFLKVFLYVSSLFLFDCSRAWFLLILSIILFSFSLISLSVYYQMQSDNQNTIPTTVSYNNNGTPNGIITLNGPNSFVPLPNMNSPPPRESNNTTSSTNSSAPASNNNTTRENNNREGSAKENNNNSNTSGLVRRNTKKRMNGYQKN